MPAGEPIPLRLSGPDFDVTRGTRHRVTLQLLKDSGSVEPLDEYTFAAYVKSGPSLDSTTLATYTGAIVGAERSRAQFTLETTTPIPLGVAKSWFMATITGPLTEDVLTLWAKAPLRVDQ